MQTVLSLTIVCVAVCVNLLFLNGSFGQTSGIEMGTLNYPVIYNDTLNIPAVQQSWLKKGWSWITRAPAPIQNITYTFPPSNQVSECRSIDRSKCDFNPDRFVLFVVFVYLSCAHT